jgi:hypothetical protein
MFIGNIYLFSNFRFALTRRAIIVFSQNGVAKYWHAELDSSDQSHTGL